MNGVLAFFTDPALGFLRNAALAALLSAVPFGVVGSVVTVRRVSGLAGAISHAVLGGIGLALFLSGTGILPGIPPIAGAIAFALIAAVVIGTVSLRAKQREDTVINAIWATGMSIGVLFMAKTPGYVDPTSYLFGNILLISPSDLVLLAVLDIVVVFLAWRFYPQIEASSFDEEFARVRGVNTALAFIVLLSVTAVAIVLLQTFVGIVMLISMLTLPAGMAGYRSKNLASMMAAASIWAGAFSGSGLALGWHFDLPAGAVTVVLSGAVFLTAAAIRIVKSRTKKSSVKKVKR